MKQFLVDEHPRPDVTLEQLAKLPPVFKKGGTVSAGNASVSLLLVFEYTEHIMKNIVLNDLQNCINILKQYKIVFVKFADNTV